MGYKEAFGDQFQLGFKLENLPVKLTDRSYSNDICPSFYFQINGQYFLLWVNHQDRDHREDPEACRYIISNGVNEGDDNAPEIYQDSTGTDLFNAEEAELLIQFVARMLEYK